jgi:hypothetical protein
MGMKLTKKRVTLEGTISVEDAEELSNWLRRSPKATVDVSSAGHVHAAVLQVLLALRPRLEGKAADPWLNAALAVSASQN